MYYYKIQCWMLSCKHAHKITIFALIHEKIKRVQFGMDTSKIIE